MDHTIELLATELRKLTGHGAAAHRLITKPILLGLAQVDETTPRHAAGHIVRRYLIGAIEAMSGPYYFQGRIYDGHTFRRALKLSLGIEQGHQLHPTRYYRIIRLLQFDCSYEQYRRRYERELLVILAEEMTGGLVAA